MRRRDRLSGILYGIVIGSALGRRTEYLPLDAIHARYGTSGKMPLPTVPHLTDSGSLALSTVEALSAARFFNAPEIVRVTRAELIRWRDEWSSEESAASITRAISGLEEGQKRKYTWTRSASLVANSAVLPKAAIAAVIPDQEKALGVSQLQTALTNAAPASLVCAEMITLATRMLLDDAHPRELPAVLSSYAQKFANTPSTYRRTWLGDIESRWESKGPEELSAAWLRMAYLLDSVTGALGRTDDIVNVCEVFGTRGSPMTALASALYFAAKYSFDPNQAVSMACRTSGESADIAALTGALIGADCGTTRFHADWAQDVNDSWNIEQYVDILFDIDRKVRKE